MKRRHLLDVVFLKWVHETRNLFSLSVLRVIYRTEAFRTPTIVTLRLSLEHKDR